MITIVIIIATSIVSVLCMKNQELFQRLMLNPYQVVQRKQYYRLITHAFVHAGWGHLAVNMLVLYFFGGNVEMILQGLEVQGYINNWELVFVAFYLIAILFSSSISVLKHKNDHWYNSVGASGAVAAILFFFVFFGPREILRLYFAIPIPAIVFAVLYVVYSHIMSKRGGDNVNHDAHLLGAVFGFIFPLFLDLSLFKLFFLENLLRSTNGQIF